MTDATPKFAKSSQNGEKQKRNTETNKERTKITGQDTGTRRSTWRTEKQRHMLQHIEDPKAWEKIYKLVNVLWLKEATYRTVEINMGVKKAR